MTPYIEVRAWAKTTDGLTVGVVTPATEELIEDVPVLRALLLHDLQRTAERTGRTLDEESLVAHRFPGIEIDLRPAAPLDMRVEVRDAEGRVVREYDAEPIRDDAGTIVGWQCSPETLVRNGETIRFPSLGDGYIPRST